MKKIMISIASLCLLALTVATISSCGAGTLLQTVGSGGTVGNIFTSVIGLDKVTERGLIGTWHYDSPGVAFTSEASSTTVPMTSTRAKSVSMLSEKPMA